MKETSCCSTSLPASGIVSVQNFGLLNRCVVISNYCFNLHVLDDIWCGAPFHMLICISSLMQCLLRSFGLFFNWVLFSYCWPLRVLGIAVLYLICLLQMRSPSLWLVFSFSWHCLLKSIKFLILMRSSLSLFLSWILRLGLCLKCHHHTQGHWGILLRCLLGVL